MKFLSYSWLDKGIVLTVLLGGFGYIVMNVLIEIFLLPLILTVWTFAWVFTLYLASLNFSVGGCDVFIGYDVMVGSSSHKT